MKNLFIFYLLILAPFGVLIWLMGTDYISAWILIGLLFFYVLVYRTYTDGKRLADKNIIPKEDIWKMVIPGKRIEHFKELYLK